MALLRNESLEVKEEQYQEKNQILGQFGEQVDKWMFYEDVFGDIEQTVPVIVSALKKTRFQINEACLFCVKKKALDKYRVSTRYYCYNSFRIYHYSRKICL